MSYANKQLLDNCIYFITTVTKDRAIVFSEKALYDIFINDLSFYRDHYEFKLYGFVILPNHVHLLIQTGDKKNISQIMHGLKSHSANEINKIRKFSGSIWQTNFYPSILDNDEEVVQKLDYIHANPIKHGYVKYPDEWPYSSYRNYYLDDEKFIKVDIIDL